MKPMQCTCSCGTTSFQTLGAPLFRILCHCTLCQQFHEAPFADILVHRAEDVALPLPVAHIFYGKRVSDAADPYPRHQGYFQSQIAFLKYLRSARRP